MTREQPARLQALAPTAPLSGPGGSIGRRILKLIGPSELRSALVANGVNATQADAASKAALQAIGRKSGEIRAVISLDQGVGPLRLMRLDASFLDSSGAIVSLAEDGRFQARKVAPLLHSRIIVARGEMNDADFYSSAVAAGVTDSLISTFAQAFVYDFNFQTEINAGDIFEAVFEQQINDNGQPVGPPRLLYASMTTSDKSRAVYRFKAPGREEGWFDGNGRSIKRSFMRTPVAGARITSHFGMRFHPILHYNKMHGGTDFAAPVGTPIYAAGAGTVVWAQMKGCNGNLAIVKHDNGWETFYLHMLRYATGIAAGVRVSQGQELGVVGTTGCSTGPHLHYEVHVDGEKVDPEQIPTERGEELTGEIRKAFFKERDRIDFARARYAG
jgi:murein DD-endopeptidase MepM/ murein hydrolase activator NlpD